MREKTIRNFRNNKRLYRLKYDCTVPFSAKSKYCGVIIIHILFIGFSCYS